MALAATWDPSLAQQYGQVIGAEELGKGASANLGPTVNIDRDPRWGRSFEALSEDPFLSSALDVAEINGVQGQDVMSQVYSMVNGSFSCDNSYLETTVLRDEWGFPGFVTSDYQALHSTQGALQGTDIEQPEGTYYGSALKSDIEKGTIPRSALNTMVQRILTEMFGSTCSASRAPVRPRPR